MEIEFKNLTEADFGLVKSIYDYYIAHTTATFHTEPITVEELREAIYVGHERYKSYLVLADGVLAGFCYLAPYKKRQAYYRSSEVTLYLQPDFRGKGLGDKILDAVEKEALAAGIKVLLGVITASNTPSLGLFAKHGFEQCALLKQVGEKFGQVLDVAVVQKIIG